MNYAMITPEQYARAIIESSPFSEPIKATLGKDTNAEYQKRARKGMKGFTVSWLDVDPFSESATIAGGEISHDNPTQKLICVDMWRRCSQWIVNSEFTWMVRMVVIFEGARECPQYDLIHTGTLRGHKSDILNDELMKCFKDAHAANASYKDGHKNKGVYLQTEFVAKIIGV